MAFPHDDLGDDELRARLVQRGLDEERAAALVGQRDDAPVARLIADLLEHRP